MRHDSGPSAPALGARERHEPGEPEGAHREKGPVGPGRGDDRAGDRQGRRGCDRARGEEGAGVLARLPVGHEAHEVGEADRAHESRADRGRGEREHRLRDGGGGGRREQSAPEQRDAGHQRAPRALRRQARAREHAEPGQDAEAGQQHPGPRRAQAEHVLGVEHHEGRERGVGADPQDLRDEHLPSTVAAQDLGQHAQRRAARLPGLGGRPQPGPALPGERRQGEQRQGERPQHEEPGGRAVDEHAADDGAGERAGEHRALLRAGRRGTLVVAEALGDERPVRRARRVQADVDGRRGQCEDDVGARAAERHRDETTRREERAAEDEGGPRAAPVAPQPRGQRHDEAGHRVHEHDGADEAGTVGDPLEQDGDVGRRDGARGAERHRDGGERPQRGQRDVRHARPQRGGGGGHVRTSGATRRRRPAATVTVAVVTPRGCASATSGSGSTRSARPARRHAVPGRRR